MRWHFWSFSHFLFFHFFLISRGAAQHDEDMQPSLLSFATVAWRSSGGRHSHCHRTFPTTSTTCSSPLPAQLNFNLNVTSELDDRTLCQITLPRCGITDIINGTTAMSAGKVNETTLFGNSNKPHFHIVSYMLSSLGCRGGRRESRNWPTRASPIIASTVAVWGCSGVRLVDLRWFGNQEQKWKIKTFLHQDLIISICLKVWQPF